MFYPLMPKPQIINPTVRFAELAHGAVLYKLVFSFNALSTAESITKLNLLQALNLTDVSISSLRGLLYACLLKFHLKLNGQPLTIESAGDLLQRVGIPAALQAVIAAWTASQPDPDPNDQPDNEDVDPATN